MALTLEPNIGDPDAFYAELLAAHEGLTDDESAAFSARLVLILANHVGNSQALSQAIAVAKDPAGVSETG